jgi:hypothetical protein
MRVKETRNHLIGFFGLMILTATFPGQDPAGGSTIDGDSLYLKLNQPDLADAHFEKFQAAPQTTRR